MFNLCNISAGQASGYYEKDNYYLRSGGGEWLGPLREHFKLPERIEPADFNRLIQMHEKFRTFELRLFISRELAHLAGDPAFRKIHQVALDRLVDKIGADLEQKHGFSIRFQPVTEFRTNRDGSLTAVLTSRNLAVNRCKQAAELLSDRRYRQLYRSEMAEGLKTLSISSAKKQFNLQCLENSGRVGFDLTFSPPKSVSIAMTVNHGFKEALKGAHDRAVHDTLEYIRENLIEYRFGRAAERIKSDDVLIAKIDHLVSRELDPQLHSHCILFNTCRGRDGKLRSIANELLYHNQKHIGLDVYRTQLAHYVREAGFAIDVQENGSWELRGIDRRQVEAFSTRRAEIENYVAEKGLDITNAADREIANLSTRRSKGDFDFDRLQQEWACRRQELGIDEKTFVREPEPGPPEGERTAFWEQLERSVEDLAGSFTRRDYISLASGEAVKQGVGLGDIEARFDRNIMERKFTALPNAGKEAELFTTRQNYEMENRIFQRVRRGLGRGTFRIDTARHLDYLGRSGLTPAQQQAVEFILSSRDRFTALNGVAGSGKTRLLKEVNQVMRAEGYEVRGLSLTGKAACILEREAEISSRTLHSFFNSLERQAGHRTPVPEGEIQNQWNFQGLKKFPGREVWFVDEANLINNRLMDYLQQAALKRGASVVLAGDFRQLQPIGGGYVYSRLILEKRIHYLDLRESFRQHRAPETIRRAVDEAAGGRIGRSVRLLRPHTVQVWEAEERFRRLAKDFASLDRRDRDQSVIITGTNKDRVRLNERVRRELMARRELAEGETFRLEDQKRRPFKREISVDDRVMFLRNDRRLGVLNGQVGKVTEINGRQLTVETVGKKLVIDTDRYRCLDLCYASTTWKAEGDSYRRVFINIDTRQHLVNHRQDYYVKISRTRESLTIYTNDRRGLLTAVSRSAFHVRARPEQILKNKLDLLPSGVRRNLSRGTDHFSRYDRLREPKHLKRAEHFYEKSLNHYERRLNRLYQNPSLKTDLLANFKQDFFPDLLHPPPDTASLSHHINRESPNNSDTTTPQFYNPTLLHDYTLSLQDFPSPKLSITESGVPSG